MKVAENNSIVIVKLINLKIHKDNSKEINIEGCFHQWRTLRGILGRG